MLFTGKTGYSRITREAKMSFLHLFPLNWVYGLTMDPADVSDLLWGP